MNVRGMNALSCCMTAQVYPCSGFPESGGKAFLDTSELKADVENICRYFPDPKQGRCALHKIAQNMHRDILPLLQKIQEKPDVILQTCQICANFIPEDMPFQERLFFIQLVQKIVSTQGCSLEEFTEVLYEYIRKSLSPVLRSCQDSLQEIYREASFILQIRAQFPTRSEDFFTLISENTEFRILTHFLIFEQWKGRKNIQTMQFIAFLLQDCLDESKRVKAILHFLTHFQVGSFVSVDPIDLAFVAQELGIFPEMLMRFLKTENIVELHHSFTEQERLIYKQSLPKIIDLYSNLFEPSDDVFDVNKLFHSINFELQKSYQFVCELGRGSFGSVHKACYGPTGKFYAIKQMYVESADPKIKEAHKAELENENAILDYINKDRPSNLVCIIRKIAAFIDAKKDLYLVLELGRCNLFEKICRDSYLTTSARFIRQFVKQMLEALRFLQSKNIVHADVKPGNILYNEKEQFVLADFGAAFIEPFVSERDKNGKILLFRRQTTDYRSPECTLFTEDYTDKIDMWSLGCICAELFFNAILFKKETSLELYRAHRERIGGYPKSLIKRSHRPRIVRKEKSPLCNSIFAAMKNRVTDMPLQEKELFINLLQKNLLVINPSKRASAQAASGHKYCAIDL